MGGSWSLKGYLFKLFTGQQGLKFILVAQDECFRFANMLFKISNLEG